MILVPLSNRHIWQSTDGSDDPTWSTTSESRRGFTDHEQMDEAGLVNMNARLYDPEVGRFVSPDPYTQFIEDGQSYNRYACARNNPLSLTALAL